ncbi:unnamed protein product [Ceutorhynchus assimilis]|uniref:CCHC-type domain-containing protein n=1 Tax=Ceutorhynchus assimilis TaxID=467358 RepID=A0A9N9MM38_9CUCU|nr:unnamed protein product [Ceutorhynchus assimilis]
MTKPKQLLKTVWKWMGWCKNWKFIEKILRMSRILNSLPAKFDHFHAACSQWLKATKHSYIEIACKKKTTRTLESETVSNALVGKIDKSNKNNKEKRNFIKKNQQGFNQNRNLSSQSKVYLDYSKNKYECNTCHEKGHFSNDCLKKSSYEEAEYPAALSGIQEICWIRRIITELGMQEITELTDLLVDNEAAIHMMDNAEERKVTKGKKHIEIRRKFINQHFGKTVCLVYLNTKEQVAEQESLRKFTLENV